MRVLAFDGASPALERQWDVIKTAGGVEPYGFWKHFFDFGMDQDN